LILTIKGGKSAVLTALAVCLGGKATFTNRGSKVSALIKEGEGWVIHRLLMLIIKIRVCQGVYFEPGPGFVQARRLWGDDCGAATLYKGWCEYVPHLRR
jgi:hypothetical protein